ncbi:hypothetical protein KKD37_04600 [Patescibacteria group bacterium]|nr:hypothetical protein [Patescibacteria group bacterium]
MTAEVTGGKICLVGGEETIKWKIDDSGKRAQLKKVEGRLELSIFQGDIEETTFRKCVVIVRDGEVYRTDRNSNVERTVVPLGNYGIYFRKNKVVKIAGTFKGFDTFPKISGQTTYRHGEMIQTKKGIKIKAIENKR